MLSFGKFRALTQRFGSSVIKPCVHRRPHSVREIMSFGKPSISCQSSFVNDRDEVNSSALKLFHILLCGQCLTLSTVVNVPEDERPRIDLQEVRNQSIMQSCLCEPDSLYCQGVEIMLDLLSRLGLHWHTTSGQA